MGAADFLLDNPILTKHLRSRLRPGQTLAWVGVVVVLCACAAWTGSFPWLGRPAAVLMLLGVQIVALTLSGSHQIRVSLGGARQSGILDFHRVSPVPPAAVALGFFLGAPIREYLVAAVTVPFALFSAYQVDPAEPWKGLLWFGQLQVAVLVTTWVVHAVAVLTCLMFRAPRGSVVAMIAVVFILIWVVYLASVGFYFGATWLLENTLWLNFFGRTVPWVVWLLLYELPLLGFLGLAAARKIRAERTHALSKAQALACMATITLLTVGGLWKISRLLWDQPPFEPTPVDAIMAAAVYGLTLAAMVLSATITPDAGEYVKGLRRAAREGRRRPSAWSDAGSNRTALFVLCGLVLVGATAVVNIVGKQPYYQDIVNAQNWGINPAQLERAKLDDQAWVAARQAMLSRPIAVGVLCAAYFGLGLQFFALRTRRSGGVLMGLFLFITWLVPLLAAAIIGMSGTKGPDPRALAVAALSPIPGIALSSGVAEPPGIESIQLAALAPAITFAFIFNYLLVVTQRKLDRALREHEKAAIPPAPVGFPHGLIHGKIFRPRDAREIAP